MAFLFHSIDDGHVPSIEYLPCSAIAPVVGLAMVQSGGNLVAATGATAPKYICLREQESVCAAGDIIPVARVQHGMIFETTWSAAAASVKLGDKVTLSGDGLQVTATTTDGVAEVVYIDGTAVGDKVRVRLA